MKQYSNITSRILKQRNQRNKLCMCFRLRLMYIVPAVALVAEIIPSSFVRGWVNGSWVKIWRVSFHPEPRNK